MKVSHIGNWGVRPFGKYVRAGNVYCGEIDIFKCCVQKTETLRYQEKQPFLAKNYKPCPELSGQEKHQITTTCTYNKNIRAGITLLAQNLLWM